MRAPLAGRMRDGAMHRLLLLLLPWLLAACAATPRADPGSDAPEARVLPATPAIHADNHAQALLLWRGAADINAWIGERFQYDPERALQLSETQRAAGRRLAIHAPADFFAAPRGVCVDLARFGVETLRAVDPAARARYLMIEFDPVTLRGNTLRRHWLATFEGAGGHYFFADSKRPGHLAGPYPATADFIADYARYRGRTVVAWRELDTWERRLRRAAGKAQAEPRR